MNVLLLDDGRLRSGWRFVIAVIMVIVVNFVAGTLSVDIARRHPHVEDAIYRPLLLILLLASFYGMTKLFDQAKGSAWAYNGLPCRGWLRETIVGALLGFGMVTVAVIAIAIVGHLNFRISATSRTLEFAVAVFLVILAAAMAEELMFRGYPFQRLVEALGAIGAILVLSALFGAVHMLNPHVSDNRWVQIFAFTNTLLIGIVLALAYLRTRALWLPWGLHFGWNATLGLLYGLPVSGINQFSVVVKARPVGPEWLLGGGYGIEGGLLGTLVILLGLVYVIVFIKPKLVAVPSAPVAELVPDGIQPNSGF
jgi:uncharacterized protein